MTGQRDDEDGKPAVRETEPLADDYRRGDLAAFEAIDQVVRGTLSRRYPGLAREHEDLAQSAHVKLLESLRARRYDAGKRLTAYVSGIAHHVAIDRLREIYRTRMSAETDVIPIAGSSPDPYRVAEAEQEGRLVHQAILAVPRGCRELWRLMLVERLSYEEIAQRLSIPTGTVKSRMWVCRRKAIVALRRLKLSRGAGPRAPGVTRKPGP